MAEYRDETAELIRVMKEYLGHYTLYQIARKLRRSESRMKKIAVSQGIDTTKDRSLRELKPWLEPEWPRTNQNHLESGPRFAETDTFNVDMYKNWLVPE